MRAATPDCALVGRETEAPDRENLFAAMAVTAGDVWAAGSINRATGAWHWIGDQPLALHWTGQAWQPVPVPGAPFAGLPDPGYTSAPPYLTAVAAAGPSDVWAVGQGLFHWDGGAWTDHTADLGTLHR